MRVADVQPYGLIVSFALASWTYRHEQRDEQANVGCRAQVRGGGLQQRVVDDELSVVYHLFVTNGAATHQRHRIH